MLNFLKSRTRAFKYAFNGIYILFKTQPNAKVHLLATVVIAGLGLWLGLSLAEWCLITICIAMVIMAEAFNTAIEYTVDLASPDIHPLAGKAKDVAAGAVLLSVIICGVVWGVIYLPKIWVLFSG